jgi:hypothetical protein
MQQVQGNFGNLWRVGKAMIEIILSHWATYVILAWLLVCIIGNLLPKAKSADTPAPPRFSPRRATRESQSALSGDEIELAHRER